MYQIRSIRNYISIKMLGFIVLFLFIIPTISVYPSLNLILTDNIDDTLKFEPDYEVQTGQPDTRGSSLLNLKLKNSETKTIKSKEAYRNVTIRDYATLIVENGELEINGTLTVQNNARFFIINSTLTISPPALPQSLIIVNISDDATIQIRDSTVITNAQPTHANISYLLSDDSTSVTIDNSKLIAHLPTIPDLSIYLTPPTAGTYILTGETTWNVKNSYLEGHLSYNETDYLTGRWFWLTLQRKATLTLKKTILTINDDTQPIMKPISGLVEIEDCEIQTGIIDAEVVANLNVDNLTISHFNLRDQTQAVVKNSHILENLDVGSPAIYSPVESGSEPEAIANIYNTTVGKSIVISGNATTEIQNCNFNDCTINNNASALIKNSTLTRAIVYDRGELEIEYSRSKNIFIEKDSKLTITNATEDIIWVRTGYNCKSTVTVTDTNIGKFEIWPGDNVGPLTVDPVDYGAGYDPELNVSEVYLNLNNCVINNVRTYDDEIVTFNLKDSKIIDFIMTQFKYETVSFTFIDINSDFIIPDIADIDDAVIYIQFKFELNVLLNNEPVKASIDVYDNNNELVTSIKTSDEGYTVFNLNSQIIDGTGTYTFEDYTYTIQVYGIEQEHILKLTDSQVHYLNLTDTEPPIITEIEFGPSTWNLEKDIDVKAIIKDDGVQSISNVTLFYSTNDGKTWRSRAMHEVDEGQYETVIPKQEWGAEVKFYIETYDVLGNKAESGTRSYSVAEEEFNIIVILIIVIIVLIIIGVIKVIIQSRKIKKYTAQKTSTRIKEAK